MTNRIRELLTAAVLRAWFARTPEPIEESLLTAAVEAAEKALKEMIG